MKRLIKILQYLSIILSLVSIFLIIFSLVTNLQLDLSVGFNLTVINIYNALSIYSGIYKFTFIVCAFWATIRQLEISQGNYQSSLSQIEFVQNDILEKRKKDITNETLKQCNFYLQELQIAFKELIETNILSGLPLDWTGLNKLTNETLKEKYSTLFDRINKIERNSKNQILITLYQLEAFSSLFIHGNLDKRLAKQLIGDTYIKQIGFLLGLISYFREDKNSVFGRNIIELYFEWNRDEE
jgi:hypothetical protein